jgi:hypothetical protein
VGRGPRGVGRGANVQNEANLRSPGRTGTPEPCRVPGSSILPFHHSSPVPIVQNKANSNSLSGFRRLDCAKQSQTWAGWDIWEAAPRGGRLCETNPVPAGPGGTGPWGQKAIMQNKPDSGGCRVGTPNPPRAELRKWAIHMTQPGPTGSMSEHVSCLVCETEAPRRPGNWPDCPPDAKKARQPRAVGCPMTNRHTRTDTRVAVHGGLAPVATRDGSRLSQMDSPIAQNEAYPRSRIGERSVGERLSCGLRMRMTTKQLRLDGGFGSIEPS